MQYKSIKGFTGWGQLGLLLLFTGIGVILAAGVQFLIGIQIVPKGIPMDKMADEMMKAMMKPENVGAARLSQALGTFCIMCLPALIFMVVCHGKNIFWLGFNRFISVKQIAIGFFIILSATFIAEPLASISKTILANFPSLNEAAKGLENTYNEQVIALSNLKSWGEFLMALIIMAFLPALFEELFFRGAIQNLLVRWWKTPLLAIIVTSLLFSIVHMSFYLFLSRAALGFVLGLMYHQSKNLWVNVIAHFLNNALAVIQLFYLSRHNEKVAIDKMDPDIPLWGGLVAVAIIFALFTLFDKASNKKRNLIAFEEQDLIEKINPFHSFE